MKIKPIATLVGLALALTPVVMMAMPASQSQATAQTTLVSAQQAGPAATQAAAVAQQQDATDACKRVRVVAAGYGEPAGGRCAAPRS